MCVCGEAGGESECEKTFQAEEQHLQRPHKKTWRGLVRDLHTGHFNNFSIHP